MSNGPGDAAYERSAPAAHLRPPEERPEPLTGVWSRPPGLRGWFMAVNHRSIGARFLVTAFIFFILAGLAALVMRSQLFAPQQDYVDSDTYNQLFTMHGTTMMFLFAIPVMQGIAIFVLPMMLGTRDMAFPRLNAFGFWIYATAGTVLWITLFAGVAPDAGWFNYPPLADARYSPDINIDFYATVISMLEIAALVAAVELIATILTMRAPGMSLNRMPLFAWAILITAFMIVFAMTPLIVASLMLEMDRKIGTHFFDVAGGGDPVLWQHLFWFFGHPEVYIMFIPALGILSAVVATSARRPLLGYPFVVLSFVIVGLISFGVWVHHMFATGRSPAGMGLFSVASFAIAIPSGVQIFAVLATLWHGRPKLSVPLLYVFGFVFIFVAGGISGVMLGSVPFDQQVHDTYFVVAHLHYVILGGVVMPLLAGMTYWFPKLTGRILNRNVGIVAFVLIFGGVNLTFFPMHFAGFWGMPRRVYTYLGGLGWEIPNQLATIGAFTVAAGVAVFIVNWWRSAYSGPPAGHNPWGAGTLEWATASPPHPYNFAHVPVVSDRHPLWSEAALAHPERADEAGLVTEGELPVDVELPGSEALVLRSDRREAIGTSVLDALPLARLRQPGPTLIPLAAAASVAVAFVGLAFHLAWVPVGVVGLVVSLLVWQRRQDRDLEEADAGPPGSLPSDAVAMSQGIRTPMWWGWLMLLVIIAIVFATLIASYFYLWSRQPEWPIPPLEPAPLVLPIIATVVLAVAVVLSRAALVAARAQKRTGLVATLVGSAAAGVVFVGLVVAELASREEDWGENVTASLDWALMGLAAALVGTLVIMAATTAVHAARGYFTAERFEGVQLLSMFAVASGVVWLAAAATVYLAPRLL